MSFNSISNIFFRKHLNFFVRKQENNLNSIMNSDDESQTNEAEDTNMVHNPTEPFPPTLTSTFFIGVSSNIDPPEASNSNYDNQTTNNHDDLHNSSDEVETEREDFEETFFSHQEDFHRSSRSLHGSASRLRFRRMFNMFNKSITLMRRSNRLFKKAYKINRRSRCWMKRCYRLFLNSDFGEI